MNDDQNAVQTNNLRADLLFAEARTSDLEARLLEEQKQACTLRGEVQAMSSKLGKRQAELDMLNEQLRAEQAQAGVTLSALEFCRQSCEGYRKDLEWLREAKANLEQQVRDLIRQNDGYCDTIAPAVEVLREAGAEVDTDDELPQQLRDACWQMRDRYAKQEAVSTHNVQVKVGDGDCWACWGDMPIIEAMEHAAREICVAGVRVTVHARWEDRPELVWSREVRVNERATVLDPRGGT